MHLPRSLPFRGLLLLSCVVLPTQVQAAEPIRAESTISDVTVYVDRAIVTRAATVQVTEGTQEILFPGLPESLDPDLLQVSGGGDAEVMILEVRAVASQLAAPANARLKELQAQLRTTEGELRTLNDRASVLQAQREFLERVKFAATTPPSAENVTLPSVDQWERLLTFYAEGLGRLNPQLQEIDRTREDVQARVHALQREIENLGPQDGRAVRDVLVRLDVTKAGSLDLALGYTVAGASWGPTYDVRVTAGSKELSLGYSAMVRQSTGEEWHGVNLTLSTARPAIGGTPPELAPWYVREAPPPSAPAARLRRAEAEAAAMAADAERASQESRKALLSPFEIAAATVEAGLTAATFVLPHTADIPADNAPHKVPVANIPLEATLTHLTIPKLAEYVYLRAAVRNTSTYPLISGPVNMYLDGTFTARSHLETVMPGEAFELDLGVDDAVGVKRQLLNRQTANTGIVSDKRRITYEVLTTVQNNRAAPIDVVVKDQLPISQHERIEVELKAPSSREAEKSPDGTLTWKFQLAPGAKRELPLRISVEHPANLPVAGLE